MDRAAEKVYGIAVGLIRLLCTALTGMLLICGFLFTCYAEDMTSQQVLTKRDFLPLSLFWLFFAIALLVLVLHFGLRNPARCKKILLVSVFGWYGVAGLVLILFSRSVPAADGMSVFSLAEQIAEGNMGVIHPTDSYLSYYPHQIGLVSYYEIFVRLWKLFPIPVSAFHFLKFLNIVWVWIFLLLQYKTVGELFQDDAAQCIYLLFSLCNLPLLFYTSFVYGEIPSLALFSAGLWALSVLLGEPGDIGEASPEVAGRGRILLVGLSVLSFAGAVALRKNMLVLMIAVIAVLFVDGLRKGRRKFLILAFVYLTVSFTVLPAIQRFYEARAESRLPSGVTAMSYFAMGMQESSRANGWYNGFNFNTYQQAELDKETADAISKEFIRQRLAYFRENHGYAVDFYRGKFFSQWLDGTYACRQATLATYGGRRAFFTRIYEGDLGPAFIAFCDVWQNLLYLGAFLFCCAAVRGKKAGKLFRWICLIGVLGGFLFHMIWEGNSRYIFPYGMLLLPYASEGLALLNGRIDGLYERLTPSDTSA